MARGARQQARYSLEVVWGTELLCGGTGSLRSVPVLHREEPHSAGWVSMQDMAISGHQHTS